jgi:hypothetical protein
LPRFQPGVEPRPPVQPFQAILAGEFDDVTTVGRVA